MASCSLYDATVLTRDIMALLEIDDSPLCPLENISRMTGICRAACRLVLYLVFICLFFGIAKLETPVAFQHSVQAGLADVVESVS